MRATVLCYNLKGTNKGRKIGMIFGFLGYKVRHVEKEEYQFPVGEVAEGRRAESVDEESGAAADKAVMAGENAGIFFEEEMLVMCPENERMLDQALMRMRKEKVQVPLKAVLTETNQSWTSVALHDEILREHEKMTGGR